MLPWTYLGNSVEKKKFISKRPELSFNEVFEQYECTVDDIFHEAAEGNLTIYYQVPPNSEVGCLCSVKLESLRNQAKSSPFVNLGDKNGKELVALFPDLKLKNVIGKDEFGKDELLGAIGKSKLFLRDTKNIDVKKMTTSLLSGAESLISDYSTDKFIEPFFKPPFSYYKKSDEFSNIYNAPIIGRCPISNVTIHQYREGYDSNPGILLRLMDNNLDIIKNSIEEFFIVPKPFLRLQEAIEADKLFVKKEDMQRLSGEPIDPDDAKPEGAVSRKSLLKLVIGMAVKGYTYDPSAKKNTAGTDIKKDLEELGIGLDAQTIRDALKEATEVIPS